MRMKLGAFLFPLLLSTTALAQQKTEPRSTTMFGAGIGMVIVGPIAALTGAAVLASAHGQRMCFNVVGPVPCMTPPTDRGEIAAGAIALSIGATAALGGLVMIILGGMRVPVKADVGGLTFPLPL